VLDANLLSRKISSALGASNGHMRLATRYMREMGFWNISVGVNRHSSYGVRVTEVIPCNKGSSEGLA